MVVGYTINVLVVVQSLQGETMPSHCSSEVLVFHDETSDDTFKFKGHILLFVPIKRQVEFETPLYGVSIEEYSPIDDLYSKITEIRQRKKFDRKFHFCKISGTTWGHYDQAHWELIQAGVDALRHKQSELFRRPLCCKMGIIFYPLSHSTNQYGGQTKKERDLRYDETFLRFLIKGAAHYLYDSEDEIVINKIITDGSPHHRLIDTGRVISRLLFDEFIGLSPLRDYVHFGNALEIIPLDSDHKCHHKSSSEYIHANLLQLADMLLGAVIQSCYRGIQVWKRPPVIGTKGIKKKEVIAIPVKTMLDKVSRRSGFRNSGHFRSFSISQADFSNGTVCFSPLEPLSISYSEDSGQLLFDAEEYHE